MVLGRGRCRFVGVAEYIAARRSISDWVDASRYRHWALARTRLCAFKFVMLTMPGEGLWIGQEMKVGGAEHFTSRHLLE